MTTRTFPASGTVETGAVRTNKIKAAGDWLQQWGACPELVIGGTSTANAMVATHPAGMAIAAYGAGLEFTVTPTIASTGAVTIDIDGLGPVTVRDQDGNPLTSTSNLKLGRKHRLKFHSASQVRVMTGIDLSALSSASNIAIFALTKTSGTAGGSTVSGADTTIVLNTTIMNDLTGCSLDTATGIITLPAGTYKITGDQQFYATGQARIKFCDAGTLAEVSGTRGTQVYTNTSNGDAVALLKGVFTIAAATTFVVRYRAANAQGTNGLGSALSVGTETYGTLMIERVG